MNRANASNKKDRLVDAAVTLLHRKGLNATSLADIAQMAGIPVGNVYYYFKTKDELALAVIERIKSQFNAAYALLDEACPDPRQRLAEAVRYYDKVRADYARYGCPVAHILEDAPSGPVAKAAASIFSDFIGWASRQFEQLGHASDAKRHAASLMAGIQGGTIMAKAFGDPQMLSDEIARLAGWLDALPNRKVPLGKFAAKSG
jgi:AcrR family transcriptional regulator